MTLKTAICFHRRKMETSTARKRKHGPSYGDEQVVSHVNAAAGVSLGRREPAFCLVTTFGRRIKIDPNQSSPLPIA